MKIPFTNPRCLVVFLPDGLRMVRLGPFVIPTYEGIRRYVVKFRVLIEFDLRWEYFTVFFHLDVVDIPGFQGTEGSGYEMLFSP